MWIPVNRTKNITITIFGLQNRLVNEISYYNYYIFRRFQNIKSRSGDQLAPFFLYINFFLSLGIHNYKRILFEWLHNNGCSIMGKRMRKNFCILSVCWILTENILYPRGSESLTHTVTIRIMCLSRENVFSFYHRLYFRVFNFITINNSVCVIFFF